MLALFQSDSGFGFSLGQVGVVLGGAVVLFIILAPFFGWVPDLIHWLANRGDRRRESGQQEPPQLSRSSRDDENA
jgi:hypothetical protein